MGSWLEAHEFDLEFFSEFAFFHCRNYFHVLVHFIRYTHAGTRIPAAAMDVLDAVLNANPEQKTTAWTGHLKDF